MIYLRCRRQWKNKAWITAHLFTWFTENMLTYIANDPLPPLQNWTIFQVCTYDNYFLSRPGTVIQGRSRGHHKDLCDACGHGAFNASCSYTLPICPTSLNIPKTKDHVLQKYLIFCISLIVGSFSRYCSNSCWGEVGREGCCFIY